MASEIVTRAPDKLPTTLDERELEFVRLYVENGGNGSDAALRAGWSEASAPSTGSRLLRRADVLEAVRYEYNQQVIRDAVLGRGVMVELALGARREDVKLGAAKDLRDRAQTHDHVAPSTAIQVNINLND